MMGSFATYGMQHGSQQVAHENRTVPGEVVVVVVEWDALVIHAVKLGCGI
jgi:hypothetical protein